jgi:hypothetical protein
MAEPRGGGYIDYVKGANIAGFKKVADAMLAFGVVEQGKAFPALDLCAQQRVVDIDFAETRQAQGDGGLRPRKIVGHGHGDLAGPHVGKGQVDHFKRGQRQQDEDRDAEAEFDNYRAALVAGCQPAQGCARPFRCLWLRHLSPAGQIAGHMRTLDSAACAENGWLRRKVLTLTVCVGSRSKMVHSGNGRT